MIGNRQVGMIQRLGAIAEQMQRQEDETNCTRLLDLLRKVHKEEFIIAFCGHFSAGKSSMLNELYGEEILPTSPIPTSANVVKIQTGTPERVTLFFNSGGSYTYEGSYSERELKELCKNGDEVIAVHVFKSNQALPEGVSLLDTPGIDSTDDAHRVATKSALHLADVIFYMMDYNHVQSEENYLFIKELNQRNKLVYLVINQIDKHRETELSFSAYQKSVEESFQNWDLQIEDIFYTSLRERQHPHNQLAWFKKSLHQLIQRRKEMIWKSAYDETTYLIDEHVRYLAEKEQPQIARLRQQMEKHTGSLTELTQQLAGLEEQYESIGRKYTQIERQYRQGIESILQNAYLMPYEVRDLAHQFLEAQKPDFKVGLFFAKSKTEQEKKRRTEAFFSKLKTVVETQLDTHVKQFIDSFSKEKKVDSEDLSLSIYQTKVSIEPDVLVEVMKEGAGVTGNYVLQYSEDLAYELKRRYRQFAQQMFALIQPKLEKQKKAQTQTLKERIEELQKAVQAGQQIEQLQQKQGQYLSYLKDLLEGEQVEEQIDLDHLLTEEEAERGKVKWVSMPKVPEEKPMMEPVPVQAEKEIQPTGSAEERTSKLKRLLDRIETVEYVMSGVSVLKSIYQEIQRKRKRVAEQQFTVALFGAFSAGKSSFANALIGENILPVSPNPTTATINKVCPPNERYQHKQAVIYFKSKETLLQDLQHVFQLFRQEIRSIEEALSRIPRLLETEDPNPKQKTSFSFLRAVQTGYAFVEKRLGSKIVISLDELEEYVAKEERSCFVEQAELYYDSYWTKRGITLVDTPGADSIHARHTGVAFQYIRDADAILYVNYYNHAFSRADREFLIQLGRVKDTFSMDKMFFIMNAADLASSEEELEAVKQYLKDQLLQYGIRNPRLFALSSLLALQEKQGVFGEKESGVQPFEQAFLSFMMGDLLLVSLQQLVNEIRRAHQMLKQLIQTTLQGNEQKAAQRQQIASEQNEMLELIESWNTQAVEFALVKEIEELLYYVRKRTFLRYQDVFIEIFNPGTLRDDANAKQRLRDCVQEMLDFMRHDLLQELRATSLRTEKWIKERQLMQLEQLVTQCQEIQTELPFSKQVDLTYTVPEFSSPFPDLDVKDFRKPMSRFKNTKSFFEKNERAKMRDEMREILEKQVDHYMKKQQEKFETHYRQEWRQGLAKVKEKTANECKEYYQNLLYVLSEQIDVSQLKQAEAELAEQQAILKEELAQL